MIRKIAVFVGRDAESREDKEGGSVGSFLVALGVGSYVENRAPAEKNKKEDSEAWGKREM